MAPASGMSTQELRAPTTYQAGSHTDQRGTPSGTNSDDRHRRRDSGSDDRYHRDDDRHRHESRSMSSSLSSSQPAWQSRPGQNYPAFPGSRVVPARQLNPQMTAYQRMLKFGSADPPKLTKNTLESAAVDTFIKYLHQLEYEARRPSAY